MADDLSCALVLLAAGASSRMGRPKQLLPVNGQPLLRLIAERALTAPVSAVVVVLGAHAAEIAPCLNGLSVKIVVNENWAEGMGSSLQTGVKAISALAPAPRGVVIALGDQPDFSAAHVTHLVEMWRVSQSSIVASEANGVLMPPALFAASHFPELLSLRGDAGARSLFQLHAREVPFVPLAAACDLDTPEDYTDYLVRQNLSL
jgi:molybdenum cofactor cytidylyltransferase